MKGNILAVFIGVVFFFMSNGEGFAEEMKYELNPQFSMKEILVPQIGKRVSVRTDAGEALEGTVTKVGDQLLHLSKLSGKDFYDAVIRIDKITSVVFKAR